MQVLQLRFVQDDDLRSFELRWLGLNRLSLALAELVLWLEG